ncbi:cytochrome c oxidase accessory protein CcoG [Paracandidimonas soli]|uniref:Cytochrome c oxidase accessory protein FixG n=1 Tax=Paracandidimonas soli TaxID=1917182 RepID=A0A4R3VCB3_9BURK|nr:cytochrome c oxidase accessory protein CcoG [Paracandidimonas soli]TCV01453.1 cytochrome c oxidase accessory protein FixG [Paracandidimonas soli]
MSSEQDPSNALPTQPEAAGKQDNPEVPAWRPPKITKPRGSSPHVEKALTDVRSKIYSRSVTGIFARWRVILVVLTQAIFYGLPWINWNGRQAVLFDLAERKFYLFGMVMWPQDVIYLAVLLVLSAFSLFLFTAMAGRLFCGYACPQTVYTEIFMWVERKVEGDRVARIRLDEQPWSLRKVRIKATKHILWILIAWWTGSTFIGYFAPIRELGMDLFTLSLGPWQWFWMVFYAVATWGNAGFLREAVCKYMCPYARFQSVMVDHDTFVVTYDHVRGEPRGGRSRKIDHKEAGLGDCVDCSLCVQVCPTGIDIRDGLQYMCIGCGACVDVCDQVMDKMNYDKGLIRYTSGRAIEERMTQSQVRKRMLRPRVIVYIALLSLIALAFVYSLATRTTLRMDIIRDRGVLGREIPGGLIENVYRLQMMNAAEEPVTLTLGVEGAPGLSISTAQGEEKSIRLEAASNALVPVVVRVPAGELEPGLHDIVLRVDSDESSGPGRKVLEKTRFYVPQ